MLSTTDFLEKQIAFVDIVKDRQLSVTNGNLVIKEWSRIVNKIPVSKLFCLFIVGECTFSTRLIDALHSFNVSIFVLSASLKSRFLISDGLEGNYVLREKQYKGEHAFWLARELIKNKVANQIFLMKAVRDKDEALKNAISSCTELYSKLLTVENPDSMRGYEGTVAKLFFLHYFKPLKRYKRMPRTRNDIPNLLLDIGYTMIYNIVEANLHLYGFDIYKWVYHTAFYERKSLVCDLVEPFRCLIDKQLRKSYNLGQINEKDFVMKQGEYMIKFECRVKYLRMLLQPIMEHREQIFEYIKWFYRSMMSNNPVLIPFYLVE